MTAEIINLSDRRNKRIVRVVRRSDGFDPYNLTIPVAAVIGLAMWAAVVVNLFTLVSHGRPPD